MKTFVFIFAVSGKKYRTRISAQDYHQAKYLFDGWVIKKGWDIHSVELISAELEPEESSIFDKLNELLRGK